MTYEKRLERCQKAITKLLQCQPHSKSYIEDHLKLKFSRDDIHDALTTLMSSVMIKMYKTSTSSSDDRREEWFEWSQRK